MMMWNRRVLKGTSQWLKIKVAKAVLNGRAVMKNFTLWFLGFFVADFFLLSSKYDADSSAFKGLLVAAVVLLGGTLFRVWKARSRNRQTMY